MYPGHYATDHPARPCFIMAETGETVTYAEYEARTNRLAHLLRAHGLVREDHISIFMENNSQYLEACAAGERTGLFYTPVNSHLTIDELAYILDNSESKVLITSRANQAIALEALKSCPNVSLCLIVDGTHDAVADPTGRVRDYASAVAAFPETPVANERLGAAMLYSSGTTGRPKGILRVLPDSAPDDSLPLHKFLHDVFRYREDMVYLSPAPLYHSAPQAAVGVTIRTGGTAIIMERFDPEAYLALVERYHVTHRSSR